MGVLIDTSILIEAERGRVNLAAYVVGREDEGLFLSVICASELLEGIHRSTSPEMRARRSAFVESILERLPILEIDLTTARIHAQIRSELAAQGNMIGAHDLWLAASCIAHGLSMVTANRREFERVPGLVLEVLDH